MLFISISCLAQQKIIIAVDKDNSNKTHVFFKANSATTIILDIDREIEDFKYLGIVEIDDHPLYLFSEYSSPAGLTRYYYFDCSGCILYTTDFFEEIEFAQIFSLNKEKQIIYYVSGNTQNCGAILTKRIVSKKISDKLFNKPVLETIKTIMVH